MLQEVVTGVTDGRQDMLQEVITGVTDGRQDNDMLQEVIFGRFLVR